MIDQNNQQVKKIKQFNKKDNLCDFISIRSLLKRMDQQKYCILCAKQLFPGKSFLCKGCQESQRKVNVPGLNRKPSKEGYCPKCTFQNQSDAIQCGICGFVFEQKLKIQQVPFRRRSALQVIHREKLKIQNYTINKYRLSSEDELLEPIKKKCQVCGFSVKEDNYETHYGECILSKCLIDEEQEMKKFKPLQVQGRATSIITCKKCMFQNDLSNEYCLSCEEELFEHIKKKCQVCGFSVKEDNYATHYGECLLSKCLIDEEQEMNKIKPLQIQEKPDMIKQLQFVKEPLKKIVKIENNFVKKPVIYPFNNGKIIKKEQLTPVCYYCYQKIQKVQFTYHVKTCPKKSEWQKNIESSNSRMTPLQVKAIIHMHDKSAKQHYSIRSTLMDRVSKLGFSSEDLDNLQFYIENYAPMIIQIHVSKHMQFFVNDTHYRSQFETNKSSGSLSRDSRIKWENRMFDNTYSKATDFQRVKYGVINFTNDPKGVQCAKSYGPSYFLLKSHVRDRCTFTDKDSATADASIATLKFGFKIVSKMNDNELKAAFKASKALQESSGVLVTYKQLQIHGPVQFDKDIERIYVSKEEIKGQNNLLELVYKFSEKFKVQHDFI